MPEGPRVSTRAAVDKKNAQRFEGYLRHGRQVLSAAKKRLLLSRLFCFGVPKSPRYRFRCLATRPLRGSQFPSRTRSPQIRKKKEKCWESLIANGCAWKLTGSWDAMHVQHSSILPTTWGGWDQSFTYCRRFSPGGAKTTNLVSINVVKGKIRKLRGRSPQRRLRICRDTSLGLNSKVLSQRRRK